MSRNLLMAVFAQLVLVAVVSANSGPARLPKDRKIVEPLLRFEGIDQYPDHVFYLSYYAYYFGHHLVEVKEGTTIKVAFQMKKDRVPEVAYISLLAMERKEFDKRKKADPSLDWLNFSTRGIPAVKLTPPKTTAPLTVKEVPLTTYRVTLQEGKLSATKVDNKKCDEEEEMIGLMPPWMFGIVSSLSMAWLGLWFARRSVPTAKPKE